MKIGDVLMRWYLKHKRNLPWRETKNPYFIWVSEIILQQTKVIQGIDYYFRFIKKFPNVSSLASADIDEVLKLWQGLGYYSRARNLHQAAKEIQILYEGKFPDHSTKLIKLKGIGRYTSAAIASICFDEKIPVVDGNVIRWISRMNGFDFAIETDLMKKSVSAKAMEYMQENNPGDFNQAMMEFGALKCVPLNPGCKTCPFKKRCYASCNDKVNEFPVKTKRKESRKRYFNYLFITDSRSVLLSKRTKKDIWEGLYEFPLIETLNRVSEKDIIRSKKYKTFFEKNIAKLTFVGTEYKHVLSHQIIIARFYKLEIKNIKNTALKNTEIVKLKNINEFPVSRLIEKFIQKELKI